MPPSAQNSSTNDQIISRLFSNQQFKNKYYEYHKLAVRCHNKFSTAEFIQRCLEHKVIPNTFKIKNQPASFTSQEFQEQWFAESKEQSIRWMVAAKEEINTS